MARHPLLGDLAAPVLLAGTAGTVGGSRPARVTVGAVYHRTDPLFKCWNIDPSENRQWETRNLSRTAPCMAKLYALARASILGYLRFGGGGADSSAYQMPGGPPPYFNCSAPPPDGGARVSLQLGKQPPHCLNATWLLNLLDFSDYSGASLIFGLDINARTDAGRWDPAPAKALITYATAQGHKFAGFELGNKQNKWMNVTEAAADFLVLRQLLAELYPNAATRPMIVGPDANGFSVKNGGQFTRKNAQYIRTFAETCKQLGVELAP